MQKIPVQAKAENHQASAHKPRPALLKHGISASRVFPDTNQVYRKTPCACGGGCPACQAKSNDLKISQPNDPAEIEADQIADRVMRMLVNDVQPSRNSSNTSDTIHRKCDECETEEQEKVSEPVMRKEAFASAVSTSLPSDTPSSIKNVINSGGQPLDTQTRSFFEPRFRTDLSHVRIFTGQAAGQSARLINARAYTLENNIVFGIGEYMPESVSGRHLLAHEIVHTGQQNSNHQAKKIHRNVTPSPWNPPIRADEMTPGGSDRFGSQTFDCGLFSMFIPSSAASITTNNVHVFFSRRCYRGNR